MPEIERLFQCIICGAAFDTKQGLRSHMRVHKGEYMRTSIHVKREAWKAFNELCKRHKTTTCHVLNTLIEGILEGAEKGNIDLPRILSPNPLIINLTHIFLGRPRSGWKAGVPVEIPHGPHCLVCGSRKVSQTYPLDGQFIEGRCLECGATWLVSPRGQKL